MENLFTDMNKPCTLDLKLGSAAYNLKKIERQKWKNSQNTSATHGFRMCGFSVFVKNAKEASFTDKYFCRQIKEDRIGEELGKYFSDGTILRKNVIEEVLIQLKTIVTVLESSSQGVRLFGASALVMYCAESADSGQDVKVKVRLVDF